jgi:hypothetical protein
MMIPGPTTTCSLRALAVVEAVLTGCFISASGSSLVPSSAARSYVPRAFGGTRTCGHRPPRCLLQNILRISRRYATTRSQRALTAVVDVHHRMPSRHRPIPSRMAFCPPLGNLRARRCGCDASFTLHIPRPSRVARPPPSGTPSGSPSDHLRITFANASGITFRSPSRTPPRSPRDHPRACISRVHRVSPRRPRFGPRSIFASIGKLGTRSRRRRAR